MGFDEVSSHVPPVPRQPYGRVSIVELLFNYYFHAMLANVEMVLQAPSNRCSDYASRLSTRTNMVLAEVRRGQVASRDALRAVLMEYVLVATAREMRQSSWAAQREDVCDEELGDTPLDVYEATACVYVGGSQEDVCCHLGKMAHLLRVFDRGMLGGSKWAAIAEGGRRLWQTGRDEDIDHFVDLVHNSGYLFDKDSERLGRSWLGRRDKRMLEYKRDAVSAYDLLSWFGVAGAPPQELRGHWDLAIRLDDALRRERGLPEDVVLRLRAVLGVDVVWQRMPVEVTLPDGRE